MMVPTNARLAPSIRMRRKTYDRGEAIEGNQDSYGLSAAGLCHDEQHMQNTQESGPLFMSDAGRNDTLASVRTSNKQNDVGNDLEELHENAEENTPKSSGNHERLLCSDLDKEPPNSTIGAPSQVEGDPNLPSSMENVHTLRDRLTDVVGGAFTVAEEESQEHRLSKELSNLADSRLELIAEFPGHLPTPATSYSERRPDTTSKKRPRSSLPTSICESPPSKRLRSCSQESRYGISAAPTDTNRSIASPRCETRPTVAVVVKKSKKSPSAKAPLSAKGKSSPKVLAKSKQVCSASKDASMTLPSTATPKTNHKDSLIKVFFSSSTQIDMERTLLNKLRDLEVTRAPSVDKCDVFCVGKGIPLKKTCNLILAITYGKPVITEDWLLDSVRVGFRHNYLNYTVRAPRQERESGASVSQTLWNEAKGYISPWRITESC